MLPFYLPWPQKEIHEQPESIFQTMRGRVKMGPQVVREVYAV